MNFLYNTVICFLGTYYIFYYVYLGIAFIYGMKKNYEALGFMSIMLTWVLCHTC